MDTELRATPPLLTAIEMGYGHMRAAYALAEAANTEVYCVDEAPLADERERQQWARARKAYEWMSRSSQIPVLGGPFELALGVLTSIPRLYPARDLSHTTLQVRYLEAEAHKGLGRGLVERLRRTGEPLLTTFFAPAVIADTHGLDRLFCVVTDADIHRVWAPADVKRTRIEYLVPTHRTLRRLRSYGVPEQRITVTGFPLPPSLLGGRELGTLRKNLAARIGRLDPRGVFRDQHRQEVEHFLGHSAVASQGSPAHVVFAVGGAGAQAGLAKRFLPGFRSAIERGRLRLTLVAGTRPAVAALFEQAIDKAGLGSRLANGIDILFEPTLPAYFNRFNQLLAETDVLWTKPSELTFFGALGIPLLLAPPVGRHESYNLRWARELGAGLKQREAHWVAERLLDWLDDGTLAGAAFAGYMRMPKFGTYRILDHVAGIRPEPSVPPAAFV
ncbi:MAG TPA: hypothetical protein VHM70_00645 [Polyangiaceae bacterium]|jgi:hypothetical protein|nr:hypothetical protein [Polyangiaceae bacterium]